MDYIHIPLLSGKGVPFTYVAELDYAEADSKGLTDAEYMKGVIAGICEIAREAGFTCAAPPQQAAPAQGNGNGGGDATIPADVPDALRAAYAMKIPMGRLKGQMLGTATSKELDYWIDTEFGPAEKGGMKFADIKAAAKKLAQWRFDQRMK